MFSKILIANRGEIACRVIKTARRMGVATVAVYSDADAKALHVEMADEAVHIGPPAARDSYLKMDVIIDAAKKTGAQAIHPGYGFLSENPDFVEAVEKAGLTFIGPSAKAIRAMGLKDAAKRLMEEAGVPVVPGYHGDNQDPAFLADQAQKIGYPVLIKASAGGGGKGMRKIDGPEDFEAGLASAQREAKAAFGNDHCLIEKYVTKPRHIEVQVFGDGIRAVHLFERDCSLQRRHQKVIEEAPAPGMTEEMRDAMGGAAVRAAEAIGYKGAGTVEFIVDGSDGLHPDRFWFMEMNTRLQVEHPVTEAITGHDLVEWQLRVAAGAPLPVAQDDLAIKGHAFEARLYAENTAKNFLPATGPLEHLRLPEDIARCDSGVRSGDRITPFYDPMIAKVITHGETRDEALGKLARALDATEVAGTVTNVAFLGALARSARFMKGDVDTGLIEAEIDDLNTPAEATALSWAIAGIGALELIDGLQPHPWDSSEAHPWDALPGWRLWGHAEQVARFETGEVRVRTLSQGAFEAETPLGPVALSLSGEPLIAETEGQRRRVGVVRHGLGLTVFAGGRATVFTLIDPLAASDDAVAGGDTIVAPMTGQIRKVDAKPGQKVQEGAVLAVMEAMKMEHSLTAPRDGIVAEVAATVGDQIEEGTVLVALEPLSNA